MTHGKKSVVVAEKQFSAWNPYPRVRVGLSFTKPSLTKQSHKDECDIGRILRKYHETGLISHIRRKPGEYRDLVDFPDFAESFNRVVAAQDAFASLPSAVRTRFNNDAAELIDFVSKRENFDEAVKLGLILPPANPSPAGGEAKGKKLSAKGANGDGEAVAPTAA